MICAVSKDLAYVVDNAGANGDNDIAGSVVSHEQRADSFLIGLKTAVGENMLGGGNASLCENCGDLIAGDGICVDVADYVSLGGVVHLNEFGNIVNCAALDKAVAKVGLMDLATFTDNVGIEFYHSLPPKNIITYIVHQNGQKVKNELREAGHNIAPAVNIGKNVL